jgi:hypothetical protein
LDLELKHPAGKAGVFVDESGLSRNCRQCRNQRLEEKGLNLAPEPLRDQEGNGLPNSL